MLKTIIIALAAVTALAVAISYICFRVVFYVPTKDKNKTLGCPRVLFFCVYFRCPPIYGVVAM